MTPKMLEDWARLNNMTIPEALKYIENHLNTAFKQQKGPAGTGPVENNYYDSF